MKKVFVKPELQVMDIRIEERIACDNPGNGPGLGGQGEGSDKKGPTWNSCGQATGCCQLLHDNGDALCGGSEECVGGQDEGSVF